jgi:hypothetical protein
MPLPTTDERKSLMICLQYASALPLNYYINICITREKLSMAKGKPQTQTGMTAEINSIPTYAI